MVVHHANTRGSWLEGHWEPPVLSVTRLSIYNHLKIKSLKNVLYQEKEKDGIEYTHPRSLPAPSVCLCVVTAATGLGGRGAAGLLGKAGTQRAGLDEVTGGGDQLSSTRKRATQCLKSQGQYSLGLASLLVQTWDIWSHLEGAVTLHERGGAGKDCREQRGPATGPSSSSRREDPVTGALG